MPRLTNSKRYQVVEPAIQEAYYISKSNHRGPKVVEVTRPLQKKRKLKDPLPKSIAPPSQIKDPTQNNLDEEQDRGYENGRKSVGSVWAFPLLPNLLLLMILLISDTK